MKKILFVSLLAWCLPWTLAAQSVDDDLYYIPTKKKEQVKVEKTEKKTTPVTETVVVKSDAPTTVYAAPEGTTVVVRDRKGKTRDVDEYNRRYDSRNYDFSQENDTLYVDEKPYDGLDGEWVNGFDGSQDDYEYATRIIRFRNPRYAISISSPLYWDVVYGLNSWDWNVYTDGLYAYAFPTFSNRLWWDWRYNSYGWGGYPYWGWNGWYAPGWSFGWSWGGWYGGWYAGWWGHHHAHHHPGWYPGGVHWGGGNHSWANAYTTRRSYGVNRAPVTRGNDRTRSRVSTTARRTSTVNGGQTVRRSTTTSGGVRRSSSTATGTSSRRVVGTRSNATRTNAASTRYSTYTRPSSTRSSTVNRTAGTTRSSAAGSTVGTTPRSSRSSATYSRGSSTSPSRSSSTVNNNRSSSVSTRSMGSSRSTSGSFSTGSSSRSSGSYSGGGGGSTRSSGGGGSRRR